MTPGAEKPEFATPAAPVPVGQVLWECAVSAAVNAFLLLLFGHIAFSIVSGLFGEMTPSMPPGFSETKSVEKESPSAHHDWHVSQQQRFVLVFAILFSVSAWARLNPYSSIHGSRAAKISRRVSNRWFGLIVGNAFGAMIAAIVISWVQKFSLSNMILQWVWGMIWVPIHTMLGHVFGNSGAIEAWFNWYGANQFKFSFWFLYITSICDDIGLPNFKSGARLLWRKWRKRRSGGWPASATTMPVEPDGSDSRNSKEPASVVTSPPQT